MFGLNISIEGNMFRNSQVRAAVADDRIVCAMVLELQGAVKHRKSNYDEISNDKLASAVLLAENDEQLQEILELPLDGRQCDMLFEAIRDFRDANYFASEKYQEVIRKQRLEEYYANSKLFKN